MIGSIASRATLTLSVVLLCSGEARSEGWCDLFFRDVAHDAATIVLADYRQPRGQEPRLTVAEVLKGAALDGELHVDLDELAGYRPIDGMQFLFALDAESRLITSVRGLGACVAISVLPIRDGRLESRYRENYDGRHKAISLDALKRELAGQATSATRPAEENGCRVPTG